MIISYFSDPSARTLQHFYICHMGCLYTVQDHACIQSKNGCIYWTFNHDGIWSIRVRAGIGTLKKSHCLKPHLYCKCIGVNLPPITIPTGLNIFDGTKNKQIMNTPTFHSSYVISKIKDVLTITSICSKLRSGCILRRAISNLLRRCVFLLYLLYKSIVYNNGFSSRYFRNIVMK
jgi:hypothetical protein